MPHPGSLWGKQMQCVIVVKLYYSLAFCFHSSGKVKNVHLLFIDYCGTYPCYRISALWFSPPKSSDIRHEIDLSWADHWLVRFRSANLRFISRLLMFGPRHYNSIKKIICRLWSVLLMNRNLHSHSLPTRSLLISWDGPTYGLSSSPR